MPYGDSLLADVLIPINADILIQVLRNLIGQYDQLFHEYAQQFAQIQTEIDARRIDVPTNEESDAAYQLRRAAFERHMNLLRERDARDDFEELMEMVGSDPLVQPDLPILPRLHTVRLTLESLGVNSIEAQLNRREEQMRNLGNIQSLLEDVQRDIARAVVALTEVLGIRVDEDVPPARHVDIATLPKIVVNESMLGGDVSACIICLNDLKLLDEVTQLPCNHMAWHSECIAIWIGQHGHTTCPYCREEISRE